MEYKTYQDFVNNYGLIISGSQFNEIKNKFNVKFYKFTNKKELYNGIQYNDGLIVCENFNEINNGIYFYDKYNVPSLVNYTILGLIKNKLSKNIYYYIRKINIPDDATIVVEHNKFKTNKIILDTKKIILETEKLRILAVKNNSYAIKFIKNPSPELCLMAVQKNPKNFRFIKNPSPELCLLAVQLNPRNIKFIKKS